MDSLEVNKSIALQFLGRLSAAGITGAAELLAEDLTWWIPGDWALSGTYTKAQIVAKLAPISESFAKLTFQYPSITAQEDRVAVEIVNTGLPKHGAVYQNTYFFLFRIRDGLIREVREYTDSLYVVRYFDAQAQPPSAATRS